MGLSALQIGLIASKDNFIKNKDVLSISVQFPSSFAGIKRLSKYFPKLLNKNNLEKIKNSTNRSFQNVLFNEILECKKIDSLDITDEEGANIIWNMNDDISLGSFSNLKSTYDIVFEGGTMEHISNTNMYLKNIFYLLKPGGHYISQVPSAGLAEHGFYQFSPTFIVDLANKNKEMMEILHLSLDSQKSQLKKNDFKGLVFNDFYKDTNFIFPPYNTIENSEKFYKDKFCKSSIATGTLINLINQSGSPMMLTYIIKKKIEKDVNFNFDQYIYRNFKIEDIVGSSNKSLLKDQKFSKKKLFKRLLKRFILGFPLFDIIKYRIITFLIFLKHKK
jgi:SAM-dependent methyltransferase